MNRYLILIFVFFITQNAFSQILWFRDFQTAQSFAMEESKLILVDFWASWCGPCKDMDSRLWSSEEFKMISENIIPLKIDIDQNREMAIKYKVASIPKVVLINASGEVIYEETGFSNPNKYLNIFIKIPKDVKVLNKSLIPLLENKKNELVYFDIGLAYQELGRKNDHLLLKDALIDKSNFYFKKIKGKESNSILNEMSELELILNLAYRGKTKQVNKKISKLDGSYSDPKLVELLNFIQAYCYKIDGDNDNFLIKKKLIENESYLIQLDG